MKRIQLYDTTLRDGAQAEDISFTLDDKVRIVEIGNRVLPRLIGIAWHRDRYQSPAARAFVDTARAVCAELEQPALSVA